ADAPCWNGNHASHAAPARPALPCRPAIIGAAVDVAHRRVPVPRQPPVPPPFGRPAELPQWPLRPLEHLPGPSWPPPPALGAAIEKPRLDKRKVDGLKRPQPQAVHAEMVGGVAWGAMIEGIEDRTKRQLDVRLARDQAGQRLPSVTACVARDGD